MTTKGESIRHFAAGHPLPDWRNFGVMLRMLLGVNALAALLALAQAATLADWPARCLDLAALVEPALLLMLALLAGLRDLLWLLPQRLAQAAVLALAVGLGWALLALGADLGLYDAPDYLRPLLLTAAAAGLMLAYFAARAQALSPALAEARLAALNARIRPHFLFNALNAALSLIRARPQQAEAAIESLADLMRAALRDPGERVALSDEIALARQYLELEKLRIGERLTVDWQIEQIPGEMPIPPLLLQPLLENAVYHGVEPLAEGGCVRIAVARVGDELHLTVANPAGGVRQTPGQHMALANIRERLALYYDLEARLEIDESPSFYQVRIVLPCRRQPL